MRWLLLVCLMGWGLGCEKRIREARHDGPAHGPAPHVLAPASCQGVASM
jgi:hypothetical protein